MTTTEHSKPVESGERAVWRVRYHGSPDLQGYNIYAFKNHTATHGDFVANLGENGSAAEALCSAHNAALLAAADKAGGEVQTREDVCTALLEAAHAFWKSEHAHGIYGAVKWVQYDSGELVIFTRGEYRKKLMAAVGDTEYGPYYFSPDTRPQPQADQPAERAELSDEQNKMLDFLCGASAWDGVWFGDKHPTEKGAYWWRKHLRSVFDGGITAKDQS